MPVLELLLLFFLPGVIIACLMTGVLVQSYTPEKAVMSPQHKMLPEYVPFDPDFAAIGAIEPVFQDRLVGYYNEELLVNNDDIVTMFSASSDVPIYLPTRRRSIKPLPKIEKELRWKPVAD